MIKQEKGITLVALVITIIVLLILAGVSIAALGGQNGILTNASKTKKETTVSEVKEAVTMAINEIVTNQYAGASEDATMNETTVQKIVRANYADLSNITIGAPNASNKSAISGTANGFTITGEIDTSGTIWKVTSVTAN